VSFSLSEETYDDMKTYWSL